MTTPNSGQFALVLDTESSGTDPFTDRLITAYVGLVRLDHSDMPVVREMEMVVLPDPDFEMPAEAAAVNGYTTERLRREARNTPFGAITTIYSALRDAMHLGAPIVAYNAAFDLTLIQAEADRVGVALPQPGEDYYVLDPSVLWRRLEPKRSGGRRLVDAVAAYHLHFPGGEYHTARFDAIAAGRIVQKQLEHDLLRGMPYDVIHEAEEIWAAEQRVSLLEYYRRIGRDTSAIRKGWPIYEKEAA